MFTSQTMFSPNEDCVLHVPFKRRSIVTCYSCFALDAHSACTGESMHSTSTCMHLNSWEMVLKENYCTLGGYLLFWTLEVWIHHMHTSVEMQVIPLESQNRPKIPIRLTIWLLESEPVVKKKLWHTYMQLCMTYIYRHQAAHRMHVIRLIHRTRKESVHANNRRLILFLLGVWQVGNRALEYSRFSVAKRK